MKNPPTIDVLVQPNIQAAIDAARGLNPGEYQCVRIAGMTHDCRLQIYGEECDRVVVERNIYGSAGVLTQYSHHQFFYNADKQREAEEPVRALHAEGKKQDCVCDACMQYVFLSPKNKNAPASIRDT